MFERCDHNDGAYQDRAEYCTSEAADPDGIASLIIDRIDDILYESGRVTNDTFYYSADSEERLMHRSLSFLRGDFESFVWPLTQAQLDIEHTFDRRLSRDRFQVAVSWLVHQVSVPPVHFTTAYALDVYPFGPLQLCVEELSVASGELETRRMTEYDLAQLYIDLDQAYSVQQAEIREAAIH